MKESEKIWEICTGKGKDSDCTKCEVLKECSSKLHWSEIPCNYTKKDFTNIFGYRFDSEQGGR